MSFFLLANGCFQKNKQLKEIVDKFDLTVSEYAFKDLDKTLYLFSWKSEETVHALKKDKDDFIGSTGTLIYKQHYGNEALSQIHIDFKLGEFKHHECTGHFNIFIKIQDVFYIYNDILGAWKIYKTDDGLISSSLFLLLELTGNLSLDTQGVYEYVLNGCTFGEKTIAEQISSLPAEKYFVLTKDNPLKQQDVFPSLVQQPDYKHKTMDELVEDYSFRLKTLFSSYQSIPAATFRSALSGGFDSRLILGCFLKTGVSPELYVYGKKQDKDVIVATDVANKAGLAIEFINKSELPSSLTHDGFSAIIERNLFMYDGLSYDGIFDNGNDYFDRLNRAKDNKVLVNGSVGEVFRHFYYLPDKKIKIEDFVKSFHCRFDSRSMSTKFNFADYLQNLTTEIQRTLQISGKTLDRVEVEKLYPLFRARYWSAKDMVNNHRFGASLYPFFEYNLINGTSTIEYDKKLYGRFEASLINKMSPTLASCMSDYGFSFDSEPLSKYKLKTNLLTYHRPIWLRQLSYAIQCRRNGAQRPEHLKKDYLSLVLDADLPFMSRFFKQTDILDADSMNRLVTLEYIAEKYNFTN